MSEIEGIVYASAAAIAFVGSLYTAFSQREKKSGLSFYDTPAHRISDVEFCKGVLMDVPAGDAIKYIRGRMSERELIENNPRLQFRYNASILDHLG